MKAVTKFSFAVLSASVLLATGTPFAQEKVLSPLTEEPSQGLAKLLVNGSPWRFTSMYENSVHQFRFSPDGKLERMSSGTPDVWKEENISESQTISYPTQRGHTITFYLDNDSRPSAKHSKHSSQFKSIKE